MAKTLVAYFSHRGMNYVGGGIVNLEIGNTQIAAEKAAALTGGDLFEISTIKKYPFKYEECTDDAKREQTADARPQLKSVIDISAYDNIILGFPNWWGTMPMAVWTFLEDCDFTDKKILPMCTHEGSGMGASERDLKKLCPSAEIKSGLAIRGSKVSSADSDIATWLKKQGIL